MNLEILLVNEETLINFIQKEKIYRLNDQSYHPEDLTYLNTDKDSFILNNLYCVYLDNEIVGFAIVPSYSPHILSRIYIKPEYRSLNIGTVLILSLNIKALSCFLENEKAMKLYKRLGFIESKRHRYVIDLIKE